MLRGANAAGGGGHPRAPVLVLLWLVFGGLVPPVEAAASRGGLQQIEEIVVRARKREELLESTPISITVLDDTALREAGVTRLDQIQDLVPNLQFNSGRDGQTARVFIRGIGPVDDLLTFDPGVGIYVDGVYLARAQGSILDVVDVEQVEVLRGPQGTLFGRNTIGGAINLTTVKPRDEIEAFAFVRAGNFGTVHTRAMLNLPVGTGVLEDKLFARAAFASQQGRGVAYNGLRDEHWTNENTVAGIASLRLVPRDDVEVLVSGSYAKEHTYARGAQCVVVQPPPVGPLVPPGFQEACAESEPFLFEADTSSLADLESWGVWGTVSWDVGRTGPLEDVLVKSITAYRRQTPAGREDIDMTRFNVGLISSAGGEGLNGSPGHQRQTSQELQVNGAALDGRLNYVLGAYAFWETGDRNAVTDFFIESPGSFRFTTDSSTQVDNWSYAFFGQATFDLNEWAALTGGVRWTEEKKGFAKRTISIHPSSDEFSIDADESALFTAWTPMAALSIQMPESLLEEAGLDHLLGYFSYARGFKSGGFNGGIQRGDPALLIPFEPEFLDSFEIGFKGIGWDQRVTLNTSFFLGKYDDIQVSTVETLVPGDPNSIERVIRNATTATTKGAEIEARLLPLDGMQVTGSVGLLDTSYGDFLSPSSITGAPIQRRGETFNQVPEFTSYLAVQYSFPVDLSLPPWLSGWLTPRLDWYYQSAVHFEGPELVQGIQRGYNLLHARLGYDFDDERSQIALWGRNLTDQAYFSSTIPLATSLGTTNRFYDAPRTFGVELSRRF